MTPGPGMVAEAPDPWGAPAAHDERLSDDDLGLVLGDDRPFVFEPASDWSPLVISFPHVGLEWPSRFIRPRPQVNFGRNADFEVHTLYPSAQTTRAARLRARFSRLLVDLNRAQDDVSAALVPDHPAPNPRQRSLGRGSANAPRIPNRGVVWDTAVGNIPILVAPLRYAELRQRISRFHAPYHRALEVLLERRRRMFGYAILLEAHSMPSSVPGDLVLGTLEGGSCLPGIEQAALAALRNEPATALDVRLNDPYRGGELVRRFGRPEEGFHALQLEVSRALYMDENSLALWPHPSAGSAVDSHGGSLHRAGAASRFARSQRARLDQLLRCIETLIQVLTPPRRAWKPRTPSSWHAPRPELPSPMLEAPARDKEPARSLVSPERERINSRPVTRDAKERTRGSE